MLVRVVELTNSNAFGPRLMEISTSATDVMTRDRKCTIPPSSGPPTINLFVRDTVGSVAAC